MFTCYNFEALLPSSILATGTAHLNFIDFSYPEYFRANTTNYEVAHCEDFLIPHYHAFWAQIFARRSCVQVPLVSVPSLMQETMYYDHISQLEIRSVYFNFQTFRESNLDSCSYAAVIPVLRDNG